MNERNDQLKWEISMGNTETLRRSRIYYGKFIATGRENEMVISMENSG